MTRDASRRAATLPVSPAGPALAWRALPLLLLAALAWLLAACCACPVPRAAQAGPALSCPRLPAGSVALATASAPGASARAHAAGPELPSSAAPLASAGAAPEKPPVAASPSAPEHPLGPALGPAQLEAILTAEPPRPEPRAYAAKVPGYAEMFERVRDGQAPLTEMYKGPHLSQRLLARVALDHPRLARLHQLATTHRGYPLPALLLTQQPQQEPRPSVYLNCAHHANEIGTPEFCYRVLEALLEERRRPLLSRFRFWFVPIVNVDGSHAHWYLSQNAGRKNGRRSRSGRWAFNEGVDLNRNYPFAWGKQVDAHNSNQPLKTHYWGPGPGSEPEVQGIMKLARAEQFSLALSFHSNARAIIYPYAAPGVKDPEPLIVRELAKVLMRHASTGVRMLDLRKTSTTRRRWRRSRRKSKRSRRRRRRKRQRRKRKRKRRRHKSTRRKSRGRQQKRGRKSRRRRDNPKLYYRLWHRVYPVYGSDQDWLLHAIGTQALLVEGPVYQVPHRTNRKAVEGFLPGFWKLLNAFDGVPRVLVRVRDARGGPVKASVAVVEHRRHEGEHWTTDYRGDRFVLFDHPGNYTVTVGVAGKDGQSVIESVPISLTEGASTLEFTLRGGRLLSDGLVKTPAQPGPSP